MNVKPKVPATGMKAVVISAPRMSVVQFTLTGTAPLMVAKFSSKARKKMEATQEAGSVAKSRKNREARDFAADVEAARHISEKGWDGVAASAFRNAMIDACRAASFVMTKAKLSVFCEADGLDEEDGTPLVQIHADKFKESRMAVRNATGVMDIRCRPYWSAWQLKPRIRFDEDMLSLDDIVNLMARVGLQVGIGEGRPFGREGCGMGFGLFTVTDVKQV